MKKTYICSTNIRRPAPLSAMWAYVNGNFVAEVLGSDITEWSSMSWYKKMGTTSQEAIDQSGHFQLLSEEEIIYRVVAVLFLNPSWLETDNYYNAYLRGDLITTTDVAGAMEQLGDMTIKLIGYPMVVLSMIEVITNVVAFGLYSRDPVSSDYNYKIEFDYGYKWEWIQIIATDLLFKKNGEVQREFVFTRQKDTMFYKDEFGLNRILNSYYPVKCNFDFNRGDEVWMTIDVMLNGYYWTRHQKTTTSDWKMNSYCYLDGYITFKLKVYTTDGIDVTFEWYDMNDNIINNITSYITEQSIYKRKNVGDDFYATYSTNDIPLNYRIWRND